MGLGWLTALQVPTEPVLQVSEGLQWPQATVSNTVPASALQIAVRKVRESSSSLPVLLTAEQLGWALLP